MTIEHSKQMMRVLSVARMLDISRKRVYQLIQEGQVEAIRIGPRQMRILRESLENYIERLRRKERVARGEEADDGGPLAPGAPASGARRPSHRVRRADRPPLHGVRAVEAFFGGGAPTTGACRGKGVGETMSPSTPLRRQSV